MDVSTPESAAGDAPRCGQSKCAKDARGFTRTLSNVLSSDPTSAMAYHAIVETKTYGDMRWRLGNDVNRLKRIPLGIFAFLRNHHRSASFQTGDLPVDMQHLWFEKRRAITSNNRA